MMVLTTVAAVSGAVGTVLEPATTIAVPLTLGDKEVRAAGDAMDGGRAQPIAVPDARRPQDHLCEIDPSPASPAERGNERRRMLPAPTGGRLEKSLTFPVGASLMVSGTTSVAGEIVWAAVKVWARLIRQGVVPPAGQRAGWPWCRPPEAIGGGVG